jgi:hypothetical protein
MGVRRKRKRKIIVEFYDPLMRFGILGHYWEGLPYPKRPWNWERDGWR